MDHKFLFNLQNVVAKIKRRKSKEVNEEAKRRF